MAMKRMTTVLVAVVLVSVLGACGGGRVAGTRHPDFCCTADECCGVRYFDADGGVHVQPCRGHVPPQASSARLLPEDGGTEEPGETTPGDALARGEPPPQPAAEFVVVCERASSPPPNPIIRSGWSCHRRWSDSGISPCESLDSCL